MDSRNVAEFIAVTAQGRRRVAHAPCKAYSESRASTAELSASHERIRELAANSEMPSRQVGLSHAAESAQLRGRPIAHQCRGMIALLAFLLVGLIVGTIARALMGERQPAAGITILAGTSAQVIVWFASRLLASEALAQPWSFFVSIGVAMLLLQVYDQGGLGTKPPPR